MCISLRFGYIWPRAFGVCRWIPKLTSYRLQITCTITTIGKIHTNFAKHFIKAETMSFEDYVEYGGEEGVRKAGKLRSEGRDYLVQPGDIFDFKVGC